MTKEVNKILQVTGENIGKEELHSEGTTIFYIRKDDIDNYIRHSSETKDLILMSSMPEDSGND